MSRRFRGKHEKWGEMTGRIAMEPLKMQDLCTFVHGRKNSGEQVLSGVVDEITGLPDAW